MNVQIRRALPEDADTLTEIAIAAKRRWNYPERWMEIWMPQLTFKPEEIRDANIFAATVNNVIAGFYRLAFHEARAVLEDLWISPAYMNQKIGRMLFEHALSTCRSANIIVLELDADPNAQGFYEKMGMIKVGEKHSEVEGQPRVLPNMEISL